MLGFWTGKADASHIDVSVVIGFNPIILFGLNSPNAGENE
jgi:hypothetical protein